MILQDSVVCYGVCLCHLVIDTGLILPIILYYCELWMKVPGKDSFVLLVKVMISTKYEIFYPNDLYLIQYTAYNGAEK